MDFPADYDTKMFPETRYLGMARAFAIWAAILFLLIAGLSWALVWTMHNSRAEPVLVSISGGGTNWTAVLGGTGRLEYSASRAMQEATVGNFAKLWFRISRDAKENEANWCQCEQSKCWDDDETVPQCKVCCASGPSLFSNFLQVVNGDFRARAAAGEEWSVVADSIRATPVGEISDKGGLWRLTASVKIDGGRTQKIEAFARTAKASEGYPSTMGYYVADFHAYPGE